MPESGHARDAALEELIQFGPAAFGRDHQPVVQRWSDMMAYRSIGAGGVASILVIKLDHVGDLVLGFDALCALRSEFPHARIDLVCAPWNEGLARSLGLFETVYPAAFFASRADGEHQPFDPAILAALQGLSWDLAIDLRVDPDTRVVLRHVTARLKVGFDSPGHGDVMTMALPHRLPEQYESNIALHQSLLMLRLVRSTADFVNGSRAVKEVLLSRVSAPSDIDLTVARGKFLVVCNTSSGRAVKNWPFDRFKRLVSWLVNDMDTAVLLIGGQDQLHETQEIINYCGSDHVISAVGTTSLNQAVGLISQASLYIGNDSGLTHIAARLDIPTVALFSGIDPTVMWAPLGEHVTVLKAPVGCSPCHILTVADCVGAQACVLNISEAAVRSAVRRHLFSAQRYGAPMQSARPTIRDVRRSAAYAGWAASAEPQFPQRYDQNYSRYVEQGGRLRLAHMKYGFFADSPANRGDLNRFYMFGLIFDQIIKEQLAGDIAELGVYKGNTAFLLADLARQLGCTAYLLDTFEGFRSDDLDGIDANKAPEFSDTSLPRVRRLVGEANVRYVQGYFPDSAKDMPESRFCLVHIDCDLYAPFKAALAYFYERLVPGGFLVMHDYSSLHWDGAERAVDEFFADKPESAVPMPDSAGTVVVRKARPGQALTNWFAQTRGNGFANAWVEAKAGPGSYFLESGWSQPEAWGTWGLGLRHVLKLELIGRPPGDVELAIESNLVLTAVRPVGTVTVAANGVPLASWTYRYDHNAATRTLRVPASAILIEDGVPVIRIAFQPDTASPPKALDPAIDDERLLGMGLVRFRQRWL